MSDIFSYGRRNWYPHMKPQDVAIWERFIYKYPAAYDTVEYDVLVGEIPAFIKNASDEAIKAEAALYQRKIDVVAHKGDNVDLIELKPQAGMSALGQIKGYGILYLRDVKPIKEPRLIVITDRLMPDMETLAAADHISLIVV